MRLITRAQWGARPPTRRTPLSTPVRQTVMTFTAPDRQPTLSGNGAHISGSIWGFGIGPMSHTITASVREGITRVPS